MKRFLALLFAGILLFSCAKPYEMVQLDSVALKSLTPTGLRSLDVLLQVQITNGGPAFLLKEPSVLFKLSGTPVMTFTFDDISVNKKTKETFDCCLHAELAKNHNIVSVMTLLGGKLDPSAATVDISFRFALHGKNGMKFELKDRPVGKLIEKLI